MQHKSAAEYRMRAFRARELREQEERRRKELAAADEWMAKVRAWAANFPQRDHIVDDSRESIYGDRC